MIILYSSSRIIIRIPGFMVTPSPSPSNKSLAALNSGAIKISREPPPTQPSPSVQYPSLNEDLNSFTPKSIPRTVHPPTNLKQSFTPHIPDRATKPDTSINSKVLPDTEASKDDFNEAKQSFEIDRSESNSSIRYLYEGMSVSSTVFLSEVAQATASSTTLLSGLTTTVFQRLTEAQRRMQLLNILV